MAQGRAVLGTRIGAVPEIVENQVTGLLAAPGDSVDLADKIQYLWDRPQLCREMGQAGQEKARWAYSEEVFYRRLMEIYAKAIELAAPR
jgi:glycosyltransferase involved in cell wall biosynthesis